MKKYLPFLILFLGATYSYAQQNAEPAIDTIKVTDKLIRKIQKGKVQLVDVRTPEEYKAGHLSYSSNMDYKKEDFKTQIAKLDKSKPVYLYCRTGNRSGKSVEILKQQGFTTVYNIGGLEYLKTLGLPAE